VTNTEFDDLRRALQNACGVALDDTKRYLIENRLAPVIKRLGMTEVSEFAARLAENPIGPLRTELVEALVTSESTFFRDHHPWEALATTVIPEFLRRRAAERVLTFWCAAASTGQEPYSLAILLRERFPEVLKSWKLSILATDVSRSTLDRARNGRFSHIEVNRGLPAPLLIKHFRQDGLQWELNEDVRRMVEFRELNLCRPWPALPACDVILLRNVMIYFSPDDKKAILSRVARVLRPGGYLLLGAAETTLNLSDSFERVPELKAGFFRLTGGGS
jgi:chemotaxis protein methyltransferase CheR